MSAALGFVGSLMWLAAVYFFYDGMVTPMTVTTEAGEVANLQLMHIQSANFLIAVGLAISGTVALCTSAILASMPPLPKGDQKPSDEIY